MYPEGLTMALRKFLSLISRTFDAWMDDEAPRLSASLAFYTILSLAPLVVLVPQIIDSLFGDTGSQGRIIDQAASLIGPQGADAIRQMMDSARTPESHGLAPVMSLITLLFGASGVFVELRSAMNKIWDVTPKQHDGIVGLVKERFFSFTIVLAAGFLLLISLVVSAVLSALSAYVAATVPTGRLLVGVVDFIVSFTGISILFALIFKFLPETDLAWKDVRLGAVVTALLFTLGKLLIGAYLGNAGVGEAYGGGGSMIVVLVWVYYSSMIFLFGAELTRVIARPTRARSAGANR
jgi:membrane protein